jgi:polyhydroxybutyrate depolymerase
MSTSGGTTGDGGYPMPFPTGMSMGCGMPPPPGDKSGGYVGHNLSLNTCPGTCNWPCEAGTVGCATDPEPVDCISPCFAPGGVASVTSTDGAHSFVKRNYGLQLPAGYDPTKAYPIMLEGGGCYDPSPAGGFVVAAGGTEGVAFIKVGLQFVDNTKDDAGNVRGQYTRCFADGAAPCTALAQNLPLCVNNPEIAYIHAVIADVESKLCVAKNQVFIGGYSSGAWESMTMGCALADEIRGIATVFGGLRLHRPACSGPIAALMVTGTADDTNPIGPLVPNMPYPPTGTPLLSAQQVTTTIGYLDSYGAVPERDDILARNGCAGTATAMYDPAYPQCLKYTGCPAKYPVVWCPLIGVTHGYELASSMGVNYVLGNNMNPLLWGFLRSLPPL